MKRMIKQLGLCWLTLLVSQFTWANSMQLNVGDATALNSKTEIGSVFISDPKVADYQVIDKNKVILFGQTVGSTDLFVFDAEGNTILSFKVMVNKSLLHVEQQISLKYPHAKIKVYNVGDNVVLSGEVATEEERDGINDLVGSLLEKDMTSREYVMELENSDQKLTSDFMTKHSYKGIVNHIEVASTKQVNVKLTIAEVTHTFAEKLGVQMGSSGQGSGIFVNSLTSFSASDIVSVISAINDDTVAQVLAEPNLSVVSGEQASFLVGGELPVVYSTDDTVTVDYKEYGIKLGLQAKVERDDKIKLALMPEVSTLDQQYKNDTFDIPALKTRRANTTVELGDGQSFILAGLLNSEDIESLKKIPFIGDIPILGALFRHTETDRKKTELIIVATVNLVKPIKATQVQLPTMKKTYSLERWLGINRQYKTADQHWENEILATGGFKK